MSVDTVRRWITILSNLYIGFELRPWFKNVAKQKAAELKKIVRLKRRFATGEPMIRLLALVGAFVFAA